ncbi:DUF4355 domain-containing protein [Lactobacillus mulieris]|uniref:DUF4355 domain-containing protein n=2 Tax=Lactobacillus TaxID=1578 RepID=A0AAP3GXA4_9LACO|nr:MULTISPECIES: DUF4355 domain-containing protein [Lactobacillus]MCW8089875.1 DUF4355 domain-containing protein [Lactobacillus jensenii]MCZ3845170.1 DUF4355 domain-containing protein [Lactobacillus mulieris]MCZ3900390.1 DUF4355 domain-containing protein [Lactobacillus mulieris]MDK6563819.1 DUF4355 domain-containing protein [Lactobacillus mulieris]MDK8082840.1 DUF4355 domain-containing protein [Lactobacillus mulieris]
MPNEEQPNVTNNGQEVKPEQAGNAEPKPEKQDGGKDYDKLTSELEKLKNRIGKEQHEKHVANDRIKELQAELDKYKQEQVDKDPEKKQDETAKQLEELKKKNEELNQQLVRNNRLNEVNSIFKKSGLNISDGILNMIVTDPNDGDSINANTQAIVDLIRQVQSDSKKELLRGNTPKASGGEVDAVAKALGL